jgi:peptide/nickel transport system permease protein
MTRVLGRLLHVVLLSLGVATLLFVVVNAVPGDPVTTMASPSASPEALDRIRATMGLDRPVHERYLVWISNLARGDLGTSYATGRPVRSLFAEIIPNTLVLSGLALLLSFVLGTLAGAVQARRPGGGLDRIGSALSLALYSVPSFWLAVMLVTVFSYMASVSWGWPVAFPASGMVSVDHEFMSPLGRIRDRIAHLVLPLSCLVLILGSGVARLVRESMVEVLDQDYIRAARARGLPEGRVLWVHGLRNGVLPALALLGLQIPLLLGGTVFVEAVFGWPGMGKLLVDGIFTRDYPVILGGSLLFSVAVVVGNMLADLMVRAADPRIRMEVPGSSSDSGGSGGSERAVAASGVAS